MSRQKTRVSLGYGIFCRNLGFSSGKSASSREHYTLDELVSMSRVNIDQTTRILGWNYTMGVRYFRLSDHFIPQLYRQDAKALCSRLKPELTALRGLLDETKGRVTFHFTNLAMCGSNSQWPSQAQRIMRYATVLDELGENAFMEVHLGARKFRQDWLPQLIRNVNSLPLWVQNKLTFENDPSWSPAETLAACMATNVPFTYDIEHHRLFARTRVSEPPTRFTPADIEGFVSQAHETWRQRGLWATVHVSSPVDVLSTEDKHALHVEYEDYTRLRRALDKVGGNYYVVLEAKEMDFAVIQIRETVTGRHPYWAVSDGSGGFV